MLGARYAAFIATPFADNSAQVDLRLAHEGTLLDREFSTSLEADTDFGFGDLFVQPVWLGWSGKHYDIAAGYGFYAPTGEDGLGCRSSGSISCRSPGPGIHLTSAGRRSCWRAPSRSTTREDADITPGERFTLNWGISQYLPLNKEQTWLAEIGTAATASGRSNRTRDPMYRNPQTQPATRCERRGPRRGYPGGTFVPWKAALTVRYQWEFDAEARFEGENLVVTRDSDPRCYASSCASRCCCRCWGHASVPMLVPTLLRDALVYDSLRELILRREKDARLRPRFSWSLAASRRRASRGLLRSIRPASSRCRRVGIDDLHFPPGILL